jgi:16S rRNA (cytidine1402-2'-O)-methyltransferase
MAGSPAFVAVIERHVMWREAPVGSGHSAECDQGANGIGTLILAAVPIGRAQDASPRLAAELATADIVAAEDTRRARRLADDLNVKIAGRLVSYYDVIEASRAAELVAELQAGKNVLVVTDAGMPGVSDPGYRVTAAAVAAGIRVTAIPGPSALTTALAVSGLPSDRFCFEGFPPRKPGERQARFTELATDARTQVFFESPRRLHVTLTELVTSHGPDRAAVVCRELTKVHEEILRGTLAELAAWADPGNPVHPAGGGGGSGGVRGEITLVVAGIGLAAAKAAARDAAREARRAARFTARAARRDGTATGAGSTATDTGSTGD